MAVKFIVSEYNIVWEALKHYEKHLQEISQNSDDEDEERPAYPFDFDDELTRDEKGVLRDQAQAILRQLSQLPEESLREYLRVAREEYGIDSGDDEG